MQLHQINPIHKNKAGKRIGRGGKRGTFSGRGSKGQNARGARLGADFRGGNPPIWKLFPKKRGSNKKTETKHRTFKLKGLKPNVVNLGVLNSVFGNNDLVNIETLREKGLITSANKFVKILGDGNLSKSLKISGLKVSRSASEKILKANGEIN